MAAASLARPRPGRELPVCVNAYVEITPFDLIKYEVDKASGYLKVDRPQRTSSQPPSLYGFIPRTYCGAEVAALCPGAERGDGDPLDICVLSERPIARAEIIVPARVVGGLQLLDRGEADDKIIAVLRRRLRLGRARPTSRICRRSWSSACSTTSQTYKLVPGAPPQITVQRVYGVEHAARVVEASVADYQALLAGQ